MDEEAKLAVQARALGIPAEVLDAKQTAALDPGVRLEIAGAVYFPLDCHLTTPRFMAALQTDVERLGAKFLWGCEALTAETDAGGQIRAIKIASHGPLGYSHRVSCSEGEDPKMRKLYAGLAAAVCVLGLAGVASAQTAKAKRPSSP